MIDKNVKIIFGVGIGLLSIWLIHLATIRLKHKKVLRKQRKFNDLNFLVKLQIKELMLFLTT